jgi:hypothetical protein
MSPSKRKQELEKDLESKIVIPESPRDGADKSAAIEAIEKESKFYDRKRKEDIHHQEMADRQSDRTQRETYAKRVFFLVLGWIILIFVLLLFQGFGPIVHYNPLSDKVLLALITSTTINLIGTLIIVLKYIFRAPAKPTSRKPLL